MSDVGKIRFLRLAGEELSRVKTRDGIGLLAEKRLHSTLKRWICEDTRCHEVKITGKGEKKRRFVADILTKDGEIFEVQTGKLYPIRPKIDFYMTETEYPVTLLHPLLREKWISWLDVETGEATARKKSPLHETPLHALAQCKPFLPYLGTKRFAICLPVLEAEEFRLLDGWGRRGKRGSHRYELIPLALLDTLWLRKRTDYAALFPTDARLKAPFTAKSFGKITHLKGYDVYNALAVLEYLGVIQKCGTEGRAALWQKIDKNPSA